MNPINLVALVDDDNVANYIAKNAIEKTHLVNKIKIFLNGKDAIDFLLENASQPSSLPEIILLDLNMPVMDGFEFLEAFAKFKPVLEKKIHIYVLSSSLSIMDFERIKKINEVSEFIIKPITQEKFERIVEALTEGIPK